MSVVAMLKRIIRWAVVQAIANDALEFPVHQVTYLGKEADGVAWYPYGYHANPGANVLALMFGVEGNPENRVIMPGSPQERIALAEGEVMFYHPGTKSFIHLKANGDIDTVAKNDFNITVAGNLNVAVEGDMIADIEGSMAAIVEGDMTATVEGDVLVDSAGDITIDAAIEVIINAATALKTTSPSNTLGDGTNDIIALMIEMCELTRDSETFHDIGRPMTAAVQTAWNTLATKVGTLA